MILPLLFFFLLRLLSAQAQASAQDDDSRLDARQVYQFTGALAIYGTPGGGTTTVYAGAQTSPPAGAVPAQCPADHPVSCTNIQQPFYCCPANEYCALANGVVACCPNGQTCQGGVAVATTTEYQQPTSATTVYQQPAPTTVYVAGAPGQATTTTVVYVSQTRNNGGGGICSTLTANGPGLPRTAQGQCGTILVIARAGRVTAMGSVELLAAVVGLQVVGGLILLWRR